MKIISTVLFFIFFNLLNAQQFSLITEIDNSLSESSGVIIVNDKIVTHNDSGGNPFLFEIDSITGGVVRTVVVGNASNIDWEDICRDDSSIYIGDFGNNSGSRTNLRVYKVSISDFLSKDTIIADTIEFGYGNQVDFTPTSFSTNFDAEALISYNDSLYIFTKNWGNFKSDIYVLPKNKGNYIIHKVDSINSNSLVTGAVYNKEINAIMLISYSLFSSSAIKLDSFSGGLFSNGRLIKTPLNTPVGYSNQIEGISLKNDYSYYIVAEENGSKKAALYKLELEKPVTIDNVKEKYNFKKILISPNPCSGVLKISVPNLSTVEIYNDNGVFKGLFLNQEIDVSTFKKGIYLIIIKDENNQLIITEKLIVN